MLKRMSSPGFAPGHSASESAALSVEGRDDSRGHNSNPGRAPQILMDDQPRGTKRWRFIRPDTREIGALVTEKAGQLGDPDILGRGLQLNERVVASQRDPCTFERLAHKERARRRRRSTEGDEIVSGKTRSSLRRSAPGEIAA
jgi:hypothetical protein